LIWKQYGRATGLADGKDYFDYAATGGIIKLIPMLGFPGKEFDGYGVEVKRKTGTRGSLGVSKTLEAAKALAQSYIDTGKPGPQPPTITIGGL
jgi:hypothetical protein